MDELLPILALLALAAVIFFTFGFAIGHDYGCRKGRLQAIDEMQPSYGILLNALSKVPNQYKDFDYSNSPDDMIWQE